MTVSNRNAEAINAGAEDVSARGIGGTPDLLTAMSHRIRAPLNGVIGMADVLAHSKLPVQHADTVRTLRESAYSLLRILDEIQDYSRIECGLLEFERTRIRIADIVEDVFASLTAAAERRGVDATLFISPEAPEAVWGDAKRIGRILFNLMDNAIRFSGGAPGRRGRVAVRVTVAEVPPFSLAFSVAAIGAGIPPETVDELFSPIAPDEPLAPGKCGGTGLGLAITKSLVELMGGNIEVASKQGDGPALIVTLPLEPATGGATPWPDLSGLNCILVESADYDARDLAVYFEHAGASARIAATLEEAARVAADLAAPIVVHSIGRERMRSELLEKTFAASPGARHVIITRGRRQRERAESPGVVTLDIGALRRQSLIRATALAAGRTAPEAGSGNGAENHFGEVFAGKSVAEARKHGELILVADDDEVNQKVILRQLALLGHAAEAAETGHEALQMWREGNYALLLTGLTPREVGGRELIRAVRAEEGARKRTPILAYAYGEEPNPRSLGIDAYLNEPLQLMPLKAALEKWLPAARNTSPSADSAAAASKGGYPEQVPYLVNVAVLKGLVGDDDGIVRQFLRDYLDSARHRAAELRAACAGDNFQAIGTVAHRLKSSSRSIGALGLGELCAELENAGRAENRLAVTEGMARFDSTFGAIVAEITNILVNER